MQYFNDAQGSDSWLAARKGCITASRFRDALDTLKSGDPSSKSTLYAMDVARERCGGTVFGPYVNAQMRYGTEQESEARMCYELERGVLVEEVGFFKTDDSLFGVSVDGLVEDDGGIEIKTLASSDVLFSVLVGKDYSSFVHQVMAGMWLLGRKWWDLVLWTPDLSKQLHVVRFNRDDDKINDMESKLMKFAGRVAEYEKKLKEALK
ncbi:MAG: YqaJ viral recombinase family protein [Opitutaceae bacterium]|nr:YqaJ viral recombinase family protein [Opitutaceae bacterium]